MWLNADRSRLIQILNNLLSNASKYSPENSGLQLNVSVDVEILTVEFIDSGLDISEDDLGRVFDPFFRSSSLETRQEQGTGIGLSVVKTLVELHKGQIDIKSTLGHGTSVSFVLPCVIEAR
jgi:signal transduction histidine kinase